MSNTSKHIPLSPKLWRISLAISLLFLSLALLTNSQSLNGNYTIGGTTPDYQNFSDAVTDLELNGVDGPVTFIVRSGTYNEHIKIDPYPFSDSTMPVTFQSETGDNNDVILRHTHTSWSTEVNYTIFINGADNLTFKQITIQADPIQVNSTGYNRVVYVTNDTENLVFKDNIIKSWYTPDGSFDYNDCISVGTDYNTPMDNRNISFINNMVIGGYVGLHFTGPLPDGETIGGEWYVSDNSFIDQYRMGIEVTNGENVKIHDNYFHSNDGQNYYQGLRINSTTDTLLISNNDFSLSGGSVGIEVSNVHHDFATSQQISNNVISIGPNPSISSTTPMGIKSSANSSLLIAHNSINIYLDEDLGYCLRTINSDVLILKNNILCHKGNGLIYYSYNNSLGDLIADNNNLYNGGSQIAELDGVNYNNLIDLNNQLSIDQFSTSYDPIFIADTLLIPLNSLVYNTGTPIPSVETDYYGTPRSEITPDVGIFEGSIPDIDAGIASSNLSNYVGCPEDSVPFFVSVKNFGPTPLTYCDVVYGNSDTIFYQTNWSGNLSQFQESENVFLGNIVFEEFQSYNLQAWSFNPNNQADVFPFNDTLISSSITALNGTYSIGDTLTDFLSISEAVNRLIEVGVCGPVVFNIESGQYDEQLIIPEIEGTSSMNTITFQSLLQDSNAVVIDYYANFADLNFVVQLNGAKYVTFKHITLQASGYSYQGVVELKNNAEYNTFSNNIFTSEGDILVHFLGGPTSSINHNTIDNNRFLNGDDQLFITGFMSNPCVDNTITNNTFEGSCGHSIDIIGQENLLISGNTFTGERYGAPSILGMEACSGIITIEKNKIGVTTSVNAMLMGIVACSGSELNPIVFKNNFIASTGPYGSLSLSLSQVDNFKLLNNNFYKNSTNYSGFREILRVSYVSGNIDIFNNAFYCEEAGKYFSSFFPVDTSLIHSDYNAYFTNGLEEFESDGIDYTLSEWQDTFGLEEHSVYTNITYVNDTNLHIVNTLGISQAGIPLPEVLEDIDFEPRDQITPDIGADEFAIDSLTYHDIHLKEILSPDPNICPLSDSLVIEVHNKSSFPITSFDVKWWSYGVYDDSLHISQTIFPHDTVVVNLGQFNFVPNTSYSLDFQVYNPNGQLDSYFNDNTALVEYFHLGNSRIFQRSNPLCSTDIELYIKDFPRESVLWSTGETEGSIIVNSSGTYSVTVTDSNGCTVTDSLVID